MDRYVQMDDVSRETTKCTCPVPHRHHHQSQLKRSVSQASCDTAQKNNLYRPITLDDHLHEVGFRILQSLQGFLAIVITISIFGASIFATLVQPLEPPPNPRWTVSTIRTYMAIAWLLFVLALAAAVFSVVQLYSEHTIELQQAAMSNDPQSGRDKVLRGIPKWKTRTALLVNLITEIFILGAFMFLSLILVAYSEKVGWAAVGLDSFFFLCVFTIWGQRLYRPSAA